MKTLLRFVAKNATSGVIVGVFALGIFSTLVYAQGAPQVPVLTDIINTFFSKDAQNGTWELKDGVVDSTAIAPMASLNASSTDVAANPSVTLKGTLSGQDAAGAGEVTNTIFTSTNIKDTEGQLWLRAGVLPNGARNSVRIDGTYCTADQAGCNLESIGLNANYTFMSGNARVLGSLGVGTTPAYNLDVVGNAFIGSHDVNSADDALMILSSGKQDARSRINFGYAFPDNQGSSFIWNVGRWPDQSFRISNFGSGTETDALTINGGNNTVGIGVAVPSEKLDVEGNIKTSGTVFATQKVSTDIVQSRDVYATGIVSIDNAVNIGGQPLAGNEKFGVNGDARITGNISAAKFIGDGSGLTNLPVGINPLAGKTIPIGGGFQKTFRDGGDRHGCEFKWGVATGSTGSGNCGCSQGQMVSTAPNGSEFYWGSDRAGADWNRQGWPILCLMTLP